jgi:hypothetical protein
VALLSDRGIVVRCDVTPGSFRRLALAMPEAVEVGHMGHLDFPLGGKFATLG